MSPALAAVGGFFLAASAALWLPVSAAPSGAAPVAGPAEGNGWLARMQTAVRMRNYHGTLIFTAGDVVSSSRVAHYRVGDQTYERIEALDGREQRVYRHNDVVQTVWPQEKVATIERRDAVTTPPLMAEFEPYVAEFYESRPLGTDRVAGREAQVLLLKARDALRFSQRVWADAATGLLLRTDVLGPQGAVLESSAFSQVEIDTRAQRETITAAMKRLEGYRVVRLGPTPARLEDEGWAVNQVPAGFRAVGCVRRPIDPLVPAGAPDAGQVLQAVFSDGLVRVSIFIEPLQPGRQRQSLATQLGATHTLMKPLDDRWWVTLMGDVPAETLRVFMSGLERRR